MYSVLKWVVVCMAAYGGYDAGVGVCRFVCRMIATQEVQSEPITISDEYDALYGPDTSTYQVHMIDAAASPMENFGVVFTINQNLPASPCYELWIPTDGFCEAEVRITGDGQQHRIPLRNVPVRRFRPRPPSFALTQTVSRGP